MVRKKINNQKNTKILFISIVFAFLGCGLLALFFGSGVTGNFFINQEKSFEWNESWNLNDSYGRVRFDSETIYVDLIYNDFNVTVDLSTINFSSMGIGYVELVINETIVDTQTFVVDNGTTIYEIDTKTLLKRLIY